MPELWTALLRWLGETPVAEAMRGSAWLYPAVEIAHILGFCVLVGAAVLFDARLLGAGSRLPVSDLARHLLPAAWLGFAVAAPTGLLLLLPEATSIGLGPVFLAKMALIAAAGLNALVFHLRVGRTVQSWNLAQSPPAAAKIAAVVSLLLWAGVVALGRLIAYL